MEYRLADKYYVKALNDYPENPASAMESLYFALEHDNEHAPALCLMGQLYMYHLHDYISAENYYNSALSCDLNYPMTYQYLVMLYIWLEEFEKAERLIDYGLKVPGLGKVALEVLRANIYEIKGDFKNASEILVDAKRSILESGWMEKVDAELVRVRQKQNDLWYRQNQVRTRSGLLKRLALW